MFRKGVILLILTSMMLHCASRMNFLSYLHEQRQEIAYILGIIAEVPISMCNSAYDFSDGLTLSDHEDGDFPIHHIQAQEIILFFGSNSVQQAIENADFIEELSLTPYSSERYLRPTQDIFLPPKI
jgi:hypothetical protein